jgi:hypothetical protein
MEKKISMIVLVVLVALVWSTWLYSESVKRQEQLEASRNQAIQQAMDTTRTGCGPFIHVIELPNESPIYVLFGRIAVADQINQLIANAIPEAAQVSFSAPPLLGGPSEVIGFRDDSTKCPQ